MEISTNLLDLVYKARRCIDICDLENKDKDVDIVCVVIRLDKTELVIIGGGFVGELRGELRGVLRGELRGESRGELRGALRGVLRGELGLRING